MELSCKTLSPAVAFAAIMVLGACGSVQAQVSENLPGSSGMLCQEPSAFVYVKKNDDSLDFAYRLYLEDGTCAFGGNALPNSSGWTYRDEHCTFSIQVEGGAVSFTTGDETCREYCGFRANINGRSIPLSAMTSSEIEPEFLGNAFYNYECPPEPNEP